MNIIDLFENENSSTLNFMDAMRDFLPFVVDHLGLSSLPKIELEKNIDDTKYPTFGRYINDEKIIQLDIKNRHPIDILRTLAHELIHYQQDLKHELDSNSGITGSPFENEANSKAGIIMRNFNQKYPKYLSLKPIIFE